MSTTDYRLFIKPKYATLYTTGTEKSRVNRFKVFPHPVEFHKKDFENDKNVGDYIETIIGLYKHLIKSALTKKQLTSIARQLYIKWNLSNAI